MSERDGLFVKHGHPNAAMRSKIAAGVRRHWVTRPRSEARVIERKRAEEVEAWLKEELAQVRAQLAKPPKTGR